MSNNWGDDVAVNFHLWKPCNLRCKFCFATFKDVHDRLSADHAKQLVALLAERGCSKLTFVGGEPTLCPYLGDLIAAARAGGMTTCVVTNGAKLRPLLDAHGADLDWIGLSVDSASEAVQAALGRGAGDHVRTSIELADLIHTRGIGLKLNTVVTALTWQEDMSALVRRIRPARWKPLQILRVTGQNDNCDDLLITAEQFQAFVARHAALEPVPEDNEAMTGSYLMIDPLGRLFDNTQGHHTYSEPILDVGLDRALDTIRWERERWLSRGGQYPWRRPPR